MLDRMEAPKGYHAIPFKKNGDCMKCDFWDGNEYTCTKKKSSVISCHFQRRKDKTNVYFVKI